MTLWRVVKASLAREAFSGEGAFLFGGRWNSIGRRVVYCSGSKALALLEVLVHIDPLDAPSSWTAFQIEVAAAQIEKAKLRPRWQAEANSQAIGDEWLKSGRTLALEIPSVIVPEEPTYLLNPGHPEFQSLDLTRVSNFELDPRFRRAFAEPEVEP